MMGKREQGAVTRGYAANLKKCFFNIEFQRGCVIQCCPNPQNLHKISTIQPQHRNNCYLPVTFAAITVYLLLDPHLLLGQ